MLYVQSDPTGVNCYMDYCFLEVQCYLGSDHYSSCDFREWKKTEYYFLSLQESRHEHNDIVSFNYDLNMACNCKTYGTMEVEIYNNAVLIKLI